MAEIITVNTVLSGIAILLMIGLLTSILSNKLKISDILFLLIAGLIIGNTTIGDYPVFQFPQMLVVGLSILALLILVFDGATSFKLRDVDRMSNVAFKLVMVFIFFNVLLVGTTTYFFFFTDAGLFEGLIVSAIFAVIVAGTDPSSVFVILEEGRKVFKMLKIEAIINTPIIVIVPFLLLDLVKSVTEITIMSFTNMIVPFLQEIIVGIGAGIFMGFVVFRLMRKFYSDEFSKIAVLATALLTYFIAEGLSGNGVLSVATLGLVFGNITMKEKESLLKFSTVLSKALEILVFILVGVAVKVDFSNKWFWMGAGLLFIITAGSRYIASHLVLRKEGYSHHELWFTTFFMPKGIPVAVLALTFKTFDSPLLSTVADLLIVTMLISIVVALILAKTSTRFLSTTAIDMGKEKLAEDKKKLEKAKKKVQVDVKKIKKSS